MKKPTTPGQLYDVLQNWFGFGAWDQGTSPMPYYKSRMIQVANLDRLLQERAISVAQMYSAACYCRDKRIAVRSPLGLCAHLRDALSADARARQIAAATVVQGEIDAAVRWEEFHHPGEGAWLGQLLRAQGQTNQKEALRSWRRARKQ